MNFSRTIFRRFTLASLKCLVRSKSTTMFTARFLSPSFRTSFIPRNSSIAFTKKPYSQNWMYLMGWVSHIHQFGQNENEKILSPFEVQFLVERKCLHARHVRLHFLAVRITYRYVNHTNLSEFFKNSLENALARLHHIVVLLMPRTEPPYRQIRYVHGVWPFARLHGVHVGTVAEVFVPFVARGERVFCLGGADFGRFGEIG